MSTSIKKLRNRAQWEVYKTGGAFGEPEKWWVICPVCLNMHEIPQEDAEKRLLEKQKVKNEKD